MSMGLYEAELTGLIHFAKPVQDLVARDYARTLCRQTVKARKVQADDVTCLGCHKEAEISRARLLQDS